MTASSTTGETLFAASSSAVRRLKAGNGLDADAEWARMYRDHADQVRRVLKAKLWCSRQPNVAAARVASSVVSTEDIEDVVQDAFLRAIESASFSRLDGDRVPYLLTIAKNRLIDLLRNQQHFVRASPGARQDDVRAELVACPDDEAPDESIDRVRAIASVSRLILQLPRELSTIYAVRFVEGLAQRDAAARLGITRRRLRTLEQRLLDRVGEFQSEAANQGRLA